MPKTCNKDDCTAPKGLCSVTAEKDYRQCEHWNSVPEKIKKASKGSAKKNFSTPWSGLEFQPEHISLVSMRSTPAIIGMVGAANAGKTSYLGMLYTLLFNGKRFKAWDFSGSYTLIGWERLGKYLRIKPNGQVDFPAPTPSNPDFYSLYHLALKKENQFVDLLFADSSGEVFSFWAKNIHDNNAENARWIYQNSQAFIFFVDCEALIKSRGKEKQNIALLAGQIAANLNGRNVLVVWSKADLISEIRPNIREAVEHLLARHFPKALSLEISNFSKKDPDLLCHQNNLKVTEHLLEALQKTEKRKLSPTYGDRHKDYFFLYRGNYDNK